MNLFRKMARKCHKFSDFFILYFCSYPFLCTIELGETGGNIGI
jgi:hypothetical protein